MIVARMEKMKSGNLIGIGNHNQRKTKNHSNKDIDKTRSHLNYDLLNRTENYKTDIENFINENKSTTRAVRKDAVLINEWIITSDQDFFKDLSKDEREKFFISSKDYFAEKFGDENIRYAKVHLDETTPHMHLGIVPFDKENRLSAKRVFNRQTLRDVQEELPNYLQGLGFEIERGRKGSERKNLTVTEFKEMKLEEEKLKEEQRKLKLENQKIKEEVNIRRNEFLGYLKDIDVSTGIENIKARREMKDVKVPSGEKFLGYEFDKTVKRATGNLIISQKDFDKIQELNSYAKEVKGNMINILEVDIYEQNRSMYRELKEIKSELKEQKRENSININDYNDLVGEYNKLNEENRLLRYRINDLRDELRLTYNSVRDNFKERLGGLKASRSDFKGLVDVISSKINNNSFEKEFDKEINREKSRGMRR